MAQEMTRRELDAMLAQGLSQREISRRTGIPRSTLQHLLKAPLVPEVMPIGGPPSTLSGPLPQTIIDAEPVLMEIVKWWMDRQAATSTPAGGKRETKRYTAHVEVELIDLVQREADAERVSYSEVINRALRQYFVGKA
jgi:hypothetical protein